MVFGFDGFLPDDFVIAEMIDDEREYDDDLDDYDPDDGLDDEFDDDI